MSNTYKTDFDRLRLDPGFSEVLSALERGFTRFGIDYYLVGAVSRNAWLSGVHGIPPRRQTGDVDFGVFISKAGMYEMLIDHLKRSEGFHASQENAFVLIWKDGTQIDLMPFGEIEDNERRVTVQGRGFTSINVDGFREVYNLGLPEIELEGKHRFKLATLPGIVLLKLIAWDDRPELRIDDITDIAEILDHFFEINRELIWDHHSDLFSEEPSVDDGRGGLLLIAARVLGKELRKIVVQTPELHERILGVMRRNTRDARTSDMGRIMAKYFEMTVDRSRAVIKEIELGLMD